MNGERGGSETFVYANLSACLIGWISKYFKLEGIARTISHANNEEHQLRDNVRLNNAALSDVLVSIDRSAPSIFGWARTEENNYTSSELTMLCNLCRPDSTGFPLICTQRGDFVQKTKTADSLLECQPSLSFVGVFIMCVH